MNVEKFVVLVKRLDNAAATVRLKVKDLLIQVSDALFENRPLPPDCPSKKGLALLMLRNIEEKLGELNTSYEKLVKFIRSA